MGPHLNVLCPGFGDVYPNTASVMPTGPGCFYSYVIIRDSSRRAGGTAERVQHLPPMPHM